MDVLTLSFRPTKLDDMVGQESLVASIRKHHLSGRMPRAWMFCGDTGSGKTTLARILACSLQQKKADEGFGNLLEKQYQGGYLGITEVNASDVNGVDDIRKLAQSSLLLPFPPSIQRVTILDEAHRITDAAQNLLLKYFEDAPKSTTWIICTTNARKILPTLRGRCTVYNMQPLTDENIEGLLRKASVFAGIDRDITPLIEYFQTVPTCSPRTMLNALEKFAAGGSAKQAAKAVTTEQIDSLRTCRRLVEGNWSIIREELKKSTPDEAKMVRLAVLGYLRSCLLNKDTNLDRLHICKSIDALSVAPYDDAFTPWLASKLYMISRGFKSS